MDDFSKTLEQLQSKAENCSQSDRQKALGFLRNLINNLEQLNQGSECESACDDTALKSPILNNTNINTEKNDFQIPIKRSLTPLKLTIRKFNKNDCNFSCQECNKKYIALTKMISHVLNTHLNSEVTCIVCKGTFHSFSLLKFHECLYSKPQIFIRRKCGICGKLCLQIEEFQLHMKEDHMIELKRLCKLFGCNYCDSTFKFRSQLLVHIPKRHKEMINKDQIAQRIRYKLLKKPVTVSPKKEIIEPVLWKTMKYSCTMCKRHFLSQRALERHFLSYTHRMRTGELKMIKKFVCDCCNSSFTKLNCLHRHMTSHQADLPHKCSVCDYRTSEKCNLTEHMRRHYQIRNHVCEFCDSKFIAKRELKDHVAFKHNSNRPYECSDCGKMFKTKRILTRHNKIHSNFRPYVCACGKNFLRMTNLRRHIVGVHHDANPSIIKVKVPIESADMDSEDTKLVWFADSKCIKVKKITELSLVQNKPPEKEIKKKIVESKKVSNRLKVKNLAKEALVQPKIDNTSTNQMLSINYMIKVPDEDDKDPKMYSSISQEFLYQSDNSDKYLQSSNSPTSIPIINGGLISNKSSLQDSSTIDDTMNICDLVTSPSYPLLEAVDPCDETQNNNKLSYDMSIKNDTLCNYKVESIMMESDNRNTIDGIWRPIDTGEDDHSIIIDDNSSSLVSNSIDMFPQNAGMISSFNEVFLSSVSNNCYSDGGVNWNNLSLGNSNSFNNDNSNFIITGTMSACDSMTDNIMPVSDTSQQTSADNFLFYNNPSQQPGDNNNHQSFAYIESYSSAINLDHNYGSMNDNMANISFCTSISNASFQQALNTSHMQDLFPISYSATSNSDYNSNSTNNNNNNNHSNSNNNNNNNNINNNNNNNPSLSNMLFNSDQPFFSTISNNNITNSNNANQSLWHHSPNEFHNEMMPPSLLESYKLNSQMTMSSSGAINSISHHPPRILSPIDFLVSDSVFPSGNKHEFCLSLHDIPVTNDLNVGINDNPLISDFCSQSHQYQHTSGQICSKNFSVVNLISTGCASQNSSKDTDDIELLYS